MFRLCEAKQKKGLSYFFCSPYLTFFSPPSGPFIERAIIASHTSEALWFKSEDVLQNPAAEKVE